MMMIFKLTPGPNLRLGVRLQCVNSAERRPPTVTVTGCNLKLDRTRRRSPEINHGVPVALAIRKYTRRFNFKLKFKKFIWRPTGRPLPVKRN